MNKKLKAKIVENFGSQVNFAQVIKTDETIISRVVCGRRSLPVDVQGKWADILHCKIKDIFPRGLNA